MGLADRFLGWLRGPTRTRFVRAKYDAAQTTDDNKKHWANADALSAREANSLDVRKKLRERARYEVANNSYAKGVVLTLANNLIGTGPTLLVKTESPAFNRQVQQAFAAWARAIRLPDQLRTMTLAKKVDGEAFAIQTNNPLLPVSVQLSMRLVECDQVTTPAGNWKPGQVDGIEFDEWGNPAAYSVLKYHPGDMLGGYQQPQIIPARKVAHWFRKDRPGQVRGIPEITPALPLFSQLRRFTLATLTAAETAAMFALVLSTSAPANTDDDVDADAAPAPYDRFPLERGTGMVAPDGYTPSQLKAEHPTTTYEVFVRALLREIFRCLMVPTNIGLGDSSAYNFSSARLDHLIYREAVGVERDDCEREVLEPLFSEWLSEATRIRGLLPDGTAPLPENLPHEWRWPGWAYMDPQVEAQADTERLANGTATLAEICAERGGDWQEKIRQRVTEKAFEQQVMQELGVKPEPETANPEGDDAEATQKAA